VGEDFSSDLDFADDVSLPAGMPEIVMSTLDILYEE